MYCGAINVMTRRRAGTGVDLVEGIAMNIKSEDGKKNGVLLMTTAALYHRELMNDKDWDP